jgi:hypothetical protein
VGGVVGHARLDLSVAAVYYPARSTRALVRANSPAVGRRSRGKFSTASFEDRPTITASEGQNREGSNFPPCSKPSFAQLCFAGREADRAGGRQRGRTVQFSLRLKNKHRTIGYSGGLDNGYAHNLQASPIEGWSRRYRLSPDCTSDSRGSSATGAGGHS